MVRSRCDLSQAYQTSSWMHFVVSATGRNEEKGVCALQEEVGGQDIILLCFPSAYDGEKASKE